MHRTAARPAAVVLALGSLVLLAACGGGSGDTTPPTPVGGATSSSSMPSATSPSTSSPVDPQAPTSTVPSPPSSSAPRPVVELRGDDLAVTRVGAPFREAVTAVSGALGRPSADPTEDTACVHSAVEVEWSGFRLAGNDGKVSGWYSTRKDLKTPSSVTVGTTVAVLRRVYGDRLLLEGPNPDMGDSFEVRGVMLAGGLSGPADTDRVIYMFNGTCGPP